MNEFNELQSAHDYLVGELILARQANDLMIKNNRELERLLVKCIQELKECRGYLIDMQQQVGELATVALARVKKS